MPRSIWTGAISFGLVTVPVKLYSAVNRKSVRFNQLNGKTGSRIAQESVIDLISDQSRSQGEVSARQSLGQNQDVR